MNFDPAHKNDPALGPPEAQAFWAEAEDLGRALMGQLEYFQQLGVEGLPPDLAPPRPAAHRAPPSHPQTAAAPVKAERASSKPAAGRPGKGQGPAADPSAWAPQAGDLSALAEKTAQCRGCPIAESRTGPPVIGRGSTAPLMLFVGPDPSIFEGEMNVLLQGMIEKGLELSPPEYHITTLVKCSPAGGTQPPASADLCCRPILDRQLALLQPKVVLALGRIPGQRLSGSSDQLGLLRPQTFLTPGLDKSWLRVTYGLEDILESADLKREAWKDLLKIKPVLAKLRTGRNS